LPPPVEVLKGVLSKITKPVTLLDVTLLSLLRKDGHPSIYGLGGSTGLDCSHWCLPGVPDTWNEILYNLIIRWKYIKIYLGWGSWTISYMNYMGHSYFSEKVSDASRTHTYILAFLLTLSQSVLEFSNICIRCS
jgi:hypothetical protein